ncbi:hypothetical protein MNBD_GAMMA23-2523 [hydrothermal vent metagenome]|uniref:Phospholipid ABC transporter shuttle protein MlaC n=1 Tax=hydrothermal vent metagenome TaxID=652676 RepID=A0A3B0ZWF0_9ZZZZ
MACYHTIKTLTEKVLGQYSMNKNRLFFALLILLNSSAIFANTEVAIEKAPVAVLKSMTYDLIEALKASKVTRKQNPDIIQQLVTTHVAPRLDFIAASRWVLGKHWRDADRAQKIRFIKEFRQLLIRFYSTALAEYALTHEINHSIMHFLPLRKKDDKDVTVHSVVHPPGSNKTVPVNYHMHKTRKGWKIYDVSVEGISMITTYKSSFAPQLRNSGVSGLIKSLVERNQKLSTKTVSLNAQN